MGKRAIEERRIRGAIGARQHCRSIGTRWILSFLSSLHWYRFQALGQSYEARGQEGAEKRCESLTAGDHVQVYYLPSNPHLSMSGDPTSGLRNEIVSIAMAATLMPALSVWSYVRRRRNNDA